MSSREIVRDTQFVEVDGVRLRVFDRRFRTAGVPLVLCNGIGASAELLWPLVEALGDHPVIVFDAPGTGLSDTPRWPPRLPRIARLIVGLFDRLGIERADVFGVSWGGALAQVLGRDHPERVRRLILASTGAGAAIVPGDCRIVAALVSPLRYWSKTHFADIAPLLYGPELAEDPCFSVEQQRLRSALPPSGRGYLWQLLALRGFASVVWLGRLPQPTLVLHGSDDRVVPTVNARILSWRIPHATLRLIESGGHLVVTARAETVAPIMRSFLA